MELFTFEDAEALSELISGQTGNVPVTIGLVPEGDRRVCTRHALDRGKSILEHLRDEIIADCSDPRGVTEYHLRLFGYRTNPGLIRYSKVAKAGGL